jgi:hypothetical protein
MTMQVDSRALVRQLRLEGVGLSLRMSAEEAFWWIVWNWGCGYDKVDWISVRLCHYHSRPNGALTPFIVIIFVDNAVAVIPCRVVKVRDRRVREVEPMQTQSLSYYTGGRVPYQREVFVRSHRKNSCYGLVKSRPASNVSFSTSLAGRFPTHHGTIGIKLS